MTTILSCAGIAAAPTEERLIHAAEIRLSELIAALSVALDITQGQPEGHCMRTALVGMRMATALRLAPADRTALYYALLLKDLGCSSNAAKIAYLFGADDHLVKRSSREIDWTKTGETIKHCWSHCRPGGSTIEKLISMAAMARHGAEGAKKIIEVRCERGADIARMLRLPEATAVAIYELDEHWNGSGHPRGLRGEEISLLGRICCVAQTVELFYTLYGLESAIDVARQRRGQWFDPRLVEVVEALHGDAAFWGRLSSADLVTELSADAPQDTALVADEECLDRVSEAFARVVDAKSPWTYRHSTRVAEIAVGVAEQFGCPADLLRDVRRAALLHDIGKLGVSNTILDKPGKPTDDEMAQIRLHPDYSLRILSKVEAFADLADVASAHHERLDGRGYHRRIGGQALPWVARVLGVADICEAMSAKRPYRDAMPWTRIYDIMSSDAGQGVDPDCLHALASWHDRHALTSRVEEQLAEVDRLLSEL